MTGHGLVGVGLRLVDGPGLASCWRFVASLLEMGDFRERLEGLIRRALVGGGLPGMGGGSPLGLGLGTSSSSAASGSSWMGPGRRGSLEDGLSRGGRGGTP